MRARVDRHDRETFIAELLKAVPTATRADALRLLRWGRTYGRLQEVQCSDEWADRDRVDCTGGDDWCHCKQYGSFDADNNEHGAHPRYMLQEERAERIIRETCENINFRALSENAPPMSFPDAVTPHFQGDPRGYTVRLQIAGAPLDAYERPALAIPTS